MNHRAVVPKDTVVIASMKSGEDRVSRGSHLSRILSSRSLPVRVEDTAKLLGLDTSSMRFLHARVLYNFEGSHYSVIYRWPEQESFVFPPFDPERKRPSIPSGLGEVSPDPTSFSLVDKVDAFVKDGSDRVERVMHVLRPLSGPFGDFYGRDPRTLLMRYHGLGFDRLVLVDKMGVKREYSF